MIFQHFIEDCGYETRSYSGRGMNGKKCLGVNVNGEITPLLFFAHLIDFATVDEAQDALLEDIVYAMRNAKTDSMGLGSIIYFPAIDFEEVE